MKKYFKFFLVFALLSFFVCGQASAAPIRLQLAHEQPENHPYHYGAVQFAELVREYSNGEIEIQIFPAGTMGRASALVESISLGTIDFASVFSILLETYAREFGVITLPFAFDSWEHAFRVLDGPIGDELKATVENAGIKVLTFWTNGIAQINSIMPIRTPDDMRGRRFRIQEGPSYAALSHALGAVTTPMSFGEVYSALQLGTIDVQLQTINNIYSAMFHEVAPYFTKVDMCFNTQPFLMSMQTWNSLTEEHQDIIMRASDEAAIRQRAFHAQDTQRALYQVAAQGGTIIELTEAELQQWRDATAIVLEDPQFAELIDTFNRIQAEK